MTTFETHWAPLARYPSNQSDPVVGIETRVRGRAPDVLTFQYVLRAPLPHVRIPSVRPPGLAHELWKHTCFEAFIADRAANSYHEFNFAPSRQWAVYRFDAYREGMSPVDVTTPPEIVVRRLEDRFELDATVRLSDLGALRDAPTLKLALTAVLEHDSGTLSYWALKHAPGKPDFHHPEGFVLELSL